MEAPDGAFLRETPVTCEGRQCSRALSAHGLVNLKQAGQSRSCIEWERGGPGRRRKPTWWRASIAEGRLWQQGPCAKTHARVNTWTHCLGSVKSMYEHTTTRCATLRGGGNTSKPPGARGVKGGGGGGRPNGAGRGRVGGRREAGSNFQFFLNGHAANCPTDASAPESRSAQGRCQTGVNRIGEPIACR
jgi:hypothetical protein